MRATPSDRATFECLLQLYDYDFSEFTDTPESIIGDDGRFPAWEPLDTYLDQPTSESERYAYLVRTEGRLGGFLLVRRLDRPGSVPTWFMQEFFVLRHERRRGLGRDAAVAAFTRFPGRWEVGVIHGNTAARAFWTTVIRDFTGGRYSVEGADDPSTPGPLFILHSPPG